MPTGSLAATPYRDAEPSLVRLRDQVLGAWNQELALVAPLLVPLIARRWARVASALVAGLLCIPRDLLFPVVVWGGPPEMLVLALYLVPLPLVLLVGWTTRFVVARRLARELGRLGSASDDALADLARLERHPPARWLAARAGRIERAASVASLVRSGLVLSMCVSALVPVALASEAVIFLAAGLGMLTVFGAWVQPLFLIGALSFERRGERVDGAPLLVVLALVSLGVTVGFWGIYGTCFAALGAGLQLVPWVIGKALLRRRLGDERSTIAALVGPL